MFAIATAGTTAASGPMDYLVFFFSSPSLASYQEGYQYRSLNANYHSAISSVHDRVVGYEIGQHMLMARLLKGVFNSRPLQPRYKGHMERQTCPQLDGKPGWKCRDFSTGPNNQTGDAAVSNQTKTGLLTWQTWISGTGSTSRRVSPSSLCLLPNRHTTKQTQGGLVLPEFPHNPKLCPVQALQYSSQAT